MYFYITSQLCLLSSALAIPSLVDRDRTPSVVWLISGGSQPGEIVWVAGDSGRLHLPREYSQNVVV